MRFHRTFTGKATAACCMAVSAFLGGHLLAEAEADQARRLRPIRGTEADANDLLEFTPPLPALAECEQAIQTIAAAYATPDLEGHLDESFPNRSEFLDALARAGLNASNIRLLVESVENSRYVPWQVIATTEQDDRVLHTIATDCVADVRVRAAFDSAESAERTVSDVSRGQWRVRFTRRLLEPREGG